MTLTWSSLLAQHRVQTHETSLQELTSLRAVVERNLRDATLPGLSEDRRLATAYSAALQLVRMVIACVGYRVVGTGHHQTTFQALPLAMGQEAVSLAVYFDLCRRKRNTVEYDSASITSKAETDDLLRIVREFREMVETWIAEKDPGWAAR